MIAAFSGVAADLATFQGGTGGWQLGTLGVADVVGDAALEIIVPYRDNSGSWKLDGFDWRGNRLAGFPYNGGGAVINVSPTLYDIDGDGKAEIFFTSGASMVALRGNGSILWSKGVSALNYVPDAGFEVVTNGFYMSPLGAFQPQLPGTAQFFSEVSPPIIADLAGNGTLELLTAWKIKPDALFGQQDYNPFINDTFGGSEWGLTGETWSGGVMAVNALTAATTLTYHFHQLVEAGLAVGQADDDGAREVYVLNDADSVVAFDRTKAHGYYGKGMLHKMFGKNQRLLSGSYLTGVDVYVADVDGDGHDEALVASSRINPNWQPSETMLDADGAILWRQWLTATSFPVTFGWFNSACMIPVNPDHDNRIDVLSFTHSTGIAFRSWNGVELVDRPGWPKDFAPRLPTPPVVGDIDGDGQEEIIIGTYDPGANPSTGSLYIFALDGAQKQVWSVPGGLKHIPSIADVNGDGSVDLVYRALDGKVYVKNFGATPGARVSWATHRGNARRDGNMGVDLFPPGTPLITYKTGGNHYGDFMWKLPPGASAHSFVVEQALQPGAPFFGFIVGQTNAAHFPILNYGEQNIFQVRAVYATGLARSAPFAITALAENNLLRNGGFEGNENSHWDKWFTGDIPWERMTVSTNAPAGGTQAMEIKLVNDRSQSSITQSSHYGIPESYLPTVPGTLYTFGGSMRSGGLSAESEHWFEWDSSRSGENPNTRPGLPWPSYFTPSLRPGLNAGGWTYLNRVFEMPAGFPNVELRHRFTVDGTASGSVFLDNVFFAALPPANDGRWVDYISFGSRWRYLTNTPPSDWYATTFPESGWPEAQAKFGAGSGPQSLRTGLPARKPAYYFRRTFTMPTTNLTTLLLAATCTDDYAGTVYPMRLYVNDTEIMAPVEAVSGEGNLVKYFDLTPFAKLLRPSPQQNVLAIVLHNGWASDWDNVAFDVALKGIPETGVSVTLPRFVSAARNANGSILLTMNAGANTNWMLESSENLVAWSLVEMVNFDGGGRGAATDNGLDDRPFPSGVAARFYRFRSP